MRNGRLVWKDGEQTATANFSIPYVGQLNIEVEAASPGAGNRQTSEERKLLAMRHAKLLVRNLVNQLEREAG